MRRVSAAAVVARRLAWALVACGALALLAPAGAPRPAPEGAKAATVPAGFQETTVLSGLTNPTVVRFSPDERVFIAEKSGLIKVYDSLLDSTPTVFADLRANVHNFWDRGLLGMALDPSFPTKPFIYALYTYDHELGSSSTQPRWGDACPTPPGATTDGCVVSARLSRLQASGNVMTGSEQVLIEDWCQQYPSHSIGTVQFGPDGALYVSGGDGASFTFVDYGQDGSPVNPCGDPPGGVGSMLTPPTAEGGSLRSQDLRTSGDPVTLDGTIIRVDPATGTALPSNPLAGNADPNARRIVAYGLRNPFRFAFRPGTSELWIGDVGWTDWEEINRILDPTDSTVENFGWPCYEGNSRHPGYDAADLSICENLYASPNADTKPFFAYNHANKVVAGESCATGSSSASGISFEFAPLATSYPAEYQGALFFADYSRDCIWAMQKSGNPIPSPGSIRTFVADAANPVNLEFGPDGNLYYVDFDGGTIRRIETTSEDKAAGRSTSASSMYGPGYEPDKAVDASSTTRWSSNFTDSQWWQVDLGSARAVDSVRLNWETAYASSYQILTSPDGTSFSLAASETANAPGWKTTSFAARSARFVRVLGVTRATPYGISFWDARIFGPPDSGGGSPEATSPPSITGSALQGQSLSASTGTWSNSPTAFAYQWQRCDAVGANCSPISTATEATYRLNAADVGSTLRVRVTATNATGTGSATSSQTEVVVADRAAGKPTSASSTYAPGFEPSAAVDDSSTTRWSSAFADSQWWQVDLGSAYSINMVRLNWEAAYAASYQILTSPDGTSFSLAASETANAPGWKTTTFTARSARFVRVLGVTRATPYGISFWDAQVFGPEGAANQPPVPVIDAPSSTLTWKVGDTITFNGHANDPEQGALPASALSWTLLLQHCPSNCHTHTLQSWTGVSSGSFNAPDHDYPSYLELKLTATDVAGASATTTLRLDPGTVVLGFASQPSGLQLSVGGASSVTPFNRTVIIGSTNSLSAPSPQTLGGTTYNFASWSDGGAQTHNVVAPAGAATWTATYAPVVTPPVNTTVPNISGPARVGRTVSVSDGTWSGSQPMSFSYQWLRCSTTNIGSCTAIVGATLKTYVVATADVSYYLRARVTAQNAGGSSSATSGTTARCRA